MEKTAKNDLTTNKQSQMSNKNVFDEIIQITNEYIENIKFKNDENKNLFRTLIAAAIGITLVYSIQRALIKYR